MNTMPINEEIEEYYKAIFASDIPKIKALLESGLSANTLKSDYRKFNEGKNVLLELLDEGTGGNTFELLNLLIKHGIDINHKDNSGNTALVYVLDYLIWWDLEEELEDEGVKSKLELTSVKQLKSLFDRIMELKPSLTLGENTCNAKDIFDFALVGGVYQWFEPYINQLTKEEQELYKSKRLKSILTQHLE